MGFIGAHLYPHWFGVPLQIQVGHSAQQFLPTVARPILLDQVAIDFPELSIVAIHLGYPWVEKMISVAWKHPNVYIGCDAHAPAYWDPSFVRFIDSSRGRNKVLFGTDWPVIDFERAVREIGELDLSDASHRRLMWDNAIELYGLETWS